MGVLLALTFSLSVYAEPDNSISSNLIIENFEYDGFVEPLNISVPFGTVHYINVDWIGEYPPTDDRYISGSFSLTTNQYFDIFIAVNADNSDYTVSTPFSDYLSKSDSFSDDFRPSSGTLLTWDSDSDSLSISNYTGSFTKEYIQFIAYKSVPAGSYDLDWRAIFTESNPEDSDFYIGVFAVPGVAPSPDDPAPDWINDPVGGFENGYYSFEEAVNQLTVNMDNLISQTTIPEVKQFYVLYYSYQLELLEKQSNIIYNSSVSDFNDQGDVIIDSFIESNTQDVSPFINQLTDLFTSTLQNASTPEQGTFLSSVFQNLLAKLQTAYEMSLYDVVSDEEVEENAADKSYLKDLFADEDEALDMFDRAQYESMLDFNVWISELKNYQQYRNIFEWFFSSSGQLRVFIIIPFAFVLVSLLLGTTTVVMSYHDVKVRRERDMVRRDQHNLRIGRG